MLLLFWPGTFWVWLQPLILLYSYYVYHYYDVYYHYYHYFYHYYHYHHITIIIIAITVMLTTTIMTTSSSSPFFAWTVQVHRPNIYIYIYIYINNNNNPLPTSPIFRETGPCGQYTYYACTICLLLYSGEAQTDDTRGSVTERKIQNLSFAQANRGQRANPSTLPGLEMYGVYHNFSNLRFKQSQNINDYSAAHELFRLS